MVSYVITLVSGYMIKIRLDCMVVGDNINIMKTTFNFDLYQAVKQQGYTKHGNKENLKNKNKLLINYL